MLESTFKVFGALLASYHQKDNQQRFSLYNNNRVANWPFGTFDRGVSSPGFSRVGPGGLDPCQIFNITIFI